MKADKFAMVIEARALLLKGIMRSTKLQECLGIEDHSYFYDVMKATGAVAKKLGTFGRNSYWVWELTSDDPPVRIPQLGNPFLHGMIRNLARGGPITSTELRAWLIKEGYSTNNVGRLATRAGLLARQISGKGTHAGWEWYNPSREAANEETYTS